MLEVWLKIKNIIKVIYQNHVIIALHLVIIEKV